MCKNRILLTSNKKLTNETFCIREFKYEKKKRKDTIQTNVHNACYVSIKKLNNSCLTYKRDEKRKKHTQKSNNKNNVKFFSFLLCEN